MLSSSFQLEYLLKWKESNLAPKISFFLFEIFLFRTKSKNMGKILLNSPQYPFFLTQYMSGHVHVNLVRVGTFAGLGKISRKYHDETVFINIGNVVMKFCFLFLSDNCYWNFVDATKNADFQTSKYWWKVKNPPCNFYLLVCRRLFKFLL